jgi:hypothetical protein
VSTTLEAPPVSARVAVRRGGTPLWALARVEGRRLVRHPILLGGAVLSLAAFIVPMWWQAPVLHREDVISGLTLLPLAGAALLATNLAALRSRRHGTDELYDSMATPPNRRTVGHLLSVGWAAAMGAAMVAVDILWLLPSHPAGSPRILELLVGPFLVALAGCTGILVARWWPTVVAGPISLVALIALALLFVQSLPSSFDASVPDRFLLPWAPLSLEWGVAPELVVRPAGWHLVYLAGLILLVASATLLRHGLRLRPTALAVGSLALTVIAAGTQLGVPTEAQARALIPLVEDPDAIRVCQVRMGVRYCAYPAYEPWIERWASAITPVIQTVAPDSRPKGLAVEQVLPYYGGDLPREAVLRIEDSFRRATPNVIHVGIRWGGFGNEADYRLGLSLVVAGWSVGLPRRSEEVVLTEEDAEAIRQAFPGDDGLVPGAQWGSCHLLGQARAVVALWLAARDTPGQEDVLKELLGAPPYGYEVVEGQEGPPSLYTDGPVLYELSNLPLETYLSSPPYIQWGIAEAFHAIQLLERPDGEVEALLHRHWDALIDPSTATSDLVRLMDLDPLPSLEQQFRQAGLDPTVLQVANQTPENRDPMCR